MNHDYNREALTDAVYMAIEFADEIAESLLATGDVYALELDGLDEYHHESHVDKEYTLMEAATVLDQLENETDWGLWEGVGGSRTPRCHGRPSRLQLRHRGTRTLR